MIPHHDTDAGGLRAAMLRIARVTEWLAQGGLWIAGLALVLMTGFVFAQVIWRYVLGSSLQWAEPGSVMIMGWFIFLGAAVGIREGYHLSFDVILYIATHRVRDIMHTISDIVVGTFGFGMLWFGWQLAVKASSSDIPGLGLSRVWDFAPLIGGGALLLIFCLERIARRAAGLPTRRFGDGTVEE
ncbi:TRAP transporter small permease [Falsirhodobacter halotolerans]|uniref:TRAP transporter small permease n=1 Tax=Falsirhodobacter halotolerans TaxID=1146892 RepID=UPI001FD265B2|nr:TRAP transporter small permease [Falsirhodobacter halotolerans]MCJ8141123.1 TRAP transporter small permease [Falsirhodobacter halotolerans]